MYFSLSFSFALGWDALRFESDKYAANVHISIFSSNQWLLRAETMYLFNSVCHQIKNQFWIYFSVSLPFKAFTTHSIIYEQAHVVCGLSIDIWKIQVPEKWDTAQTVEDAVHAVCAWSKKACHASQCSWLVFFSTCALFHFISFILVTFVDIIVYLMSLHFVCLCTIQPKQTNHPHHL